MPLPIKQSDGKGNEYYEVANIRITKVLSVNRDPSKNWAGGDTIRIQGIGVNGPVPGAEFQIGDTPTAIQVMLELFK